MADVEALVERTLNGDADAWPELQRAVEPTIVAMARRHRGLRDRGLAVEPDDVAEIATATLERLSRSNFQNLRRYVERAVDDGSRGESFDAWLYGAVDFVIREHLRKRFGRAPKHPSSAAPRFQPSKRDLHSQAGRLQDAELDRSLLHTLGMTAKLTAAQVLEHVCDSFSAAEVLAIRLFYLEDQDYEVIAARLELASAKDAERLIRRLVARLRYRFLESEAAHTIDE